MSTQTFAGDHHPTPASDPDGGPLRAVDDSGSGTSPKAPPRGTRGAGNADAAPSGESAQVAAAVDDRRCKQARPARASRWSRTDLALAPPSAAALAEQPISTARADPGRRVNHERARYLSETPPASWPASCPREKPP